MTNLPPDGKVFTGVVMGDELSDFERRTGKRPEVWGQFVAWDRPYRWAIDRARDAGTRLLLALSTAPGQDQPGTISPGEIAAGRGDRWLLALRADLDGFGAPVYLRFLGEMNNCHNAYAPMACSGRSRGRSHSAATFVDAWRRVTAVMRGTSRAQVDRVLRRAGLPALRAPGDVTPARIAMVWSPMTAGSPMVSALDPGRFWPGRRWMDWVGTSFYSKFPNFHWLSPFYERFSARPRLPFMFAEWAMWENGDPGFVRRLLSWTATHPRTRMLAYNQGKDPDGPFRLGRFRGAAQALRNGLGGRRFDLP